MASFFGALIGIELPQEMRGELLPKNEAREQIDARLRFICEHFAIERVREVGRVFVFQTSAAAGREQTVPDGQVEFVVVEIWSIS